MYLRSRSEGAALRQHRFFRRGPTRGGPRPVVQAHAGVLANDAVDLQMLLAACSLKVGSTLQTVCRLPSTSTMSPTSTPSRCMSAGSMRAMPRPASLPVDSLTERDFRE